MPRGAGTTGPVEPAGSTGPGHRAPAGPSATRTTTVVGLAVLAAVAVAGLSALLPRWTPVVLTAGTVVFLVLQLVHGRRRTQDPTPWRWLSLGVALVVLSTPTVLRAAPGTSDPTTLFTASTAAVLLAYPALFSGSLRLLHYRRTQVLPRVHAWFDGLGSLLALGAIAAADPVPALVADGTGAPEAWARLARPLVVLVLAAFAAANCQLVGWRTDRRLLKVLGSFLLLLTAEVVDLLTALGDGSGGPGAAAAAGARAAALVLLGAAAWRPAPRPTAAGDIDWAAMAGPVSIFCLTLVAGFLATVRQDRSLLTFALTAAALIVVALKIVTLVRTLVDLLESRRLSLVDDLTGLPNRRAFFEAVEQHADRDGIAVMLLDLNGFKAVNDTYGHALGDRLLQDSARRLEAVLPEHASLARLGGDEFVVLLPTADPLTVARVAEEVHRTLGPRTVDGRHLPISVSIGIAHGSAPAPAPRPEAPAVRGARRAVDAAAGRRRGEDLLHAADVAMYEAKKSGGGWRVAAVA